jgi:hypothetical protein
MERIVNARIWPDASGGQIFFAIKNRKCAWQMIFDMNKGICDVVDRHLKAGRFQKYANPCDLFKRCNLSITKIISPPVKLNEIGVPGVFKILEECAAHDAAETCVTLAN